MNNQKSVEEKLNECERKLEELERLRLVEQLLIAGLKEGGFSDNREELIERRRNIEKVDPSLQPGSPEMAKARATVFKNLDALVDKKFGPGLPNLLKQFVCMVVRMDSINEAIESIHNNLDRIKEEKDKGEDRKHIILKS